MPRKGPEREAYENDLSECFIVRMPRELRDEVQAHAAWMGRRRKQKPASLAAASRDLLRRGLMTTPGGHEKRRQERKRRLERAERESHQLGLFVGEHLCVG